MERAKAYFAEYRGILLALTGYLIVTSALFGAGVYWSAPNLTNIGCNLLAGALQLIFTAIVFERFLTSQKEKHDLPRRIWAYEDIRKWFNGMIWLYQAAYRRASGNNAPANIDAVLHRDFFNQVLRLNLDDEGPMLPFRKWEQLVADQASEFVDDGRRILDRDSEKIPPNVSQAVHTITTGEFLESGQKLVAIRAVSNQYVAQGGGHAPLWLYNSPGISDDEIAALKEIHAWLTEFYNAHAPTTTLTRPTMLA